MKKNQQMIIGVGLMIVAAIFFLWPVKVTCGHPKGMCIYEDGDYFYASYAIEPWIVKQIESVTNSDIPISYSNGRDQFEKPLLKN